MRDMYGRARESTDDFRLPTRKDRSPAMRGDIGLQRHEYTLVTYDLRTIPPLLKQ